MYIAQPRHSHVTSYTNTSADLPLSCFSFPLSSLQASTGRKTGALDLNMGKVSANGPFTPAVIALRSVVGEKKFNQIRGKGITLHSQVYPHVWLLSVFLPNCLRLLACLPPAFTLCTSRG